MTEVMEQYAKEQIDIVLENNNKKLGGLLRFSYEQTESKIIIYAQMPLKEKIAIVKGNNFSQTYRKLLDMLTNMTVVFNIEDKT